MAERRGPGALSPEPDLDAETSDEPTVSWDDGQLAAPPRGLRSAMVHVKVSTRPMAPRIGMPARPHLLQAGSELDPRLVMLTDPDSARAAAFRGLCDGVLERGVPRVLAVSSSASHEGKTPCALNLALALAERRSAGVLLVDANFFAPALAEVFAIDERTPSLSLRSPGLAPYKLVDLTPRLHVAAIVRDRAATPLDPRMVDTLIDRLSGIGYDCMIVDMPALDGSLAVRRLVAMADAVLLTVRCGRTTTSALRRAVGQITEGKLLGATLMDAEQA